MLYRLAPFRQNPDEITRAELEAIGLGDPTASLRWHALRDLLLVILIFVIAFFIATAFELGEKFHAFVISHEDWELDEILAAAFFGALAFIWLAWRQWHGYSDEVSRRLKLEEELIEMRVMADHLGENKSLFLANLAHDFRTPLNGILGFVQLLEEEPFGPIGNDRYKTYITTIHESAVMLNERISTCLDPDKIEFGAEPLQMNAYPLRKAVDAAMPVVQAMARSASIDIVDTVPADLPELHADGRALKKIIINLMTNALKHSRPNGTVGISAATAEEKSLVLRIEDNGVGMDPRMIAALTEGHPPDLSEEEATNTRKGVGLFVVKKLLDMHQATLAIENRLDGGTTVTVTFPADRVITPS